MVSATLGASLRVYTARGKEDPLVNGRVQPSTFNFLWTVGQKTIGGAQRELARITDTLSPSRANHDGNSIRRLHRRRLSVIGGEPRVAGPPTEGGRLGRMGHGTLFTSIRKGQSCDLSIKCFALTYSRRPC